MGKTKCKDYIIIRVCYYADAYLKDKHKETDITRKEHWERAKSYTKFKYEFIEKVTGLPYTYFVKKYFMSGIECAFEQIQDDFGIMVEHHRSGWYTYYLPNHMVELAEWMKEHLTDNPYKIVSRDYLPRIMEHEDLQWKRKEYECNLEQYLKID